jgi:SAM-dependent methyltransferase
MEAWYENNSFWAAVEDVLFSPDRLDAAKTEVDGVRKLLALEPGAKVLDLCCGPGRHSLELARRGYRVTGVDRTGLYLNRARESARELGLDVEFVEEDMRRFLRPGAFDAAINLFTSFGYFENEPENLHVLENIHRSLKPGGAALIDTISKEIAARSYAERTWVEVGDILLLDHRSASPDWKWTDQRWIIVRDGKKQEFRWKLRLYTAAELKGLLERAGFKRVRFYGGLEGTPYGGKAKRLVAVARKNRYRGKLLTRRKR